MRSLVAITLAAFMQTSYAEKVYYDEYYFPVDETRMTKDWSRKQSNYIKNAGIPGCTRLKGDKWCWND